MFRRGSRGRGAAGNPPNRFEKLHYEPDPDAPAEEGVPRTELYRDATRSILSKNDSPDVGFDVQRQPVPRLRARLHLLLRAPDARVPRLLGRARLRDAILVKEDAPRAAASEALARAVLDAASRSHERRDGLLPARRAAARLTRRCLEVFAEFRHPVAIITKSELVTRDLDLLADLAAHGAAGVSSRSRRSTTRSPRAMEPRASTPAAPARRDPRARERGHSRRRDGRAGHPGADRPRDPRAPRGRGGGRRALGGLHRRCACRSRSAPLFEDWLERALPAPEGEGARRVLRGIRGGGLNDPRFGSRMTGEGRTRSRCARSSPSRRGRSASRPARPRSRRQRSGGRRRLSSISSQARRSAQSNSRRGGAWSRPTRPVTMSARK